MSAPWAVAFVAQWIAVIVLALVVLAMMRQVALLTRAANSGALRATDPDPTVTVGVQIDPVEIPLTEGEPFVIDGGLAARPLLIVSLSPSCGSCATAAADAAEFARTGRADMLVVMHAGALEARRFATQHGLDGIPLAIESSLPAALVLPRGTPGVVALRPDGRVAAAGPIDSGESLAEVAALAAGTASERPDPQLAVHINGGAAR